MARKSRQDPEIREFILQNVNEHPANIVSVTMEKFGYSRPGINRYMQKLAGEGYLAFHGNTYARRYNLKPLIESNFLLKVDFLWTEDEVWRDRILPLMAKIPKNIIGVCQYGFTEMLNNVIDHSATTNVDIYYCQTYNEIMMRVTDHGKGIFEKIKNDFHLDDPRTALLELSKGKLTSDKRNHAGEGIYFTSRSFDSFRIRSGNLFYSRAKRDGDGWLIEVNDRTAYRKGTLVEMRIKMNADWSLRDVFDTYQGDNLKFRKTHVPIKLAQYPGEQLVSRSQAKRLLTRFENFSEVFLDFKDIEEIGQAFADEIFRVYRDNNPDISIVVAFANEDIKKMIEFVNPGKTVFLVPPKKKR
jgi:anti-sigma regulatory factor (Ser/Thr protein kinase)